MNPTPTPTLRAYQNCTYTKAQAVAMMQEHRHLPEVTLPAVPALTRHRFSAGGCSLILTSINARGDEIWLQRDYCPERNDRLGIWYGSETRVDSAGRAWRSSLPLHVVNDFGYLVEAPA